jgi:hypothetical protein
VRWEFGRFDELCKRFHADPGGMAHQYNSVMTATSTEQWETSCLVNDTFGTTSWLFQDVCDVTFIVFHRVVRQRHLLR